jgi:superfamily II DNA or RNA helicase
LSKKPKVPNILNTSENNFNKEFYEPCLKWADFYDRGVGYFTSGWIKTNARGLSYFAAKGGKARWITSLNISEKDYIALTKGLIKPNDLNIIQIMKQNVNTLKSYLENKTLNALGWLIYDGIIVFKFALPTNKLESGDFHDKFGIFYKKDGLALSFNGSVNDSIKGEINYESIKVFKSWEGMNFFVEEDRNRFKKIWNNEDPNINIYELPQAIKKDLFNLRTESRPYSNNKQKKDNKWRHQDKAVEEFLLQKNGILEMATGTGKTRTSLKILNRLFEQGEINNVVITAEGTDLLDQWEKEIYKWTELNLYKHYSSNKEMADFKYNVEGSIILISNHFLSELISHFKPKIKNNSLIISDEVHNFGSNKMVKKLSGEISEFKYRLGLSATPERAYDEEGNLFLENEIGETIYEFNLKDAIKRGILCEFDYYPLEYELTQADKDKKRAIIARYNALKKEGKSFSEKKLFIQLSNVIKGSLAKLPIFEVFLKNHLEIIQNSLIFVHSKDYGEKLQRIIIQYDPEYHTYYSGDNKDNLFKFSQGKINCLITCKKLSEGIDIKSVNNIVLFASDKSRLQTIQRIGRSLRINPNNPDKVARVVDFIEINTEADQERREWLSNLSSTERKEN